MSIRNDDNDDNEKNNASDILRSTKLFEFSDDMSIR